MKKRYCAEGLQLKDKPRSGQPKKLDSRGEQSLIALACSPAPEGREVWTMQMPADKLVELQVVKALSDEAVRLRLTKNELKPWLKERWCFTPITPDFVWRMEDILDLYEAYDAAKPLVCLDERPCQLLGEGSTPQPRPFAWCRTS